MTRTKSRHGLTLIEVIIAMAIAAVLAVAISYAFGAELMFERHVNTARAAADQSQTMEQTIRRAIEGARLSVLATNRQPYMVSGQPVSYFQGLTANGSNDLGCETLTFTTTAPGIPIASVNDPNDFTTQNDDRGAVGGLAEISFTTVPIGDAGSATGLFERMQRPADADPTQGGNEWVLDPDIQDIGFQFWDGNEWVANWDTTTMTPPLRLPAAVQVSYRLKGDPTNTTHLFVVPVPVSDVTANDPATSTGNS